MVSDSPAQPAQLPKSDSPAPSSSRSASFISADLNVRLSGRIVGDGEAGRIEGLQVELDQGGITVVRLALPLSLSRRAYRPLRGDSNAIRGLADTGLARDTQRYPQLLSVQTKPELQTLSSTNTGERLLTLPTPFITASSGSSDSNEYDDAFEDDSGSSTPKKTVVTLHEGFLPASETEQIEQSPLFSSTFKILVDSPSFPAPHFDPASLAPLTPSVKPLDPTSASSAAAYGGILNSPTLQRALLSPLLSPQRRAASQGSDLSVPPLSLGLSRTSRASFSGAGERPRVQGGAQPSLVSLIPSLAPPASGPSTASSSSTDPPHSSSVPHGPSLATTLTHALSSSAKKTAEEILSLRRTHDAYQRRAKAELEILEQRIEIARQNGAGEGAEGVVRGFKTREEREKSVSASRSRERDEKDKKEEGKKAGSGSRSRTRGTSGERRGESTAYPKSAYMDEEMSSRIREQDEREEEERGRSRSRSRGGSGGNGRQASARGSSEQYTQSANAQRSRSRTKAVAEATAKAVEGAQQRGQSGSRERAGQSAGAATDERGRGRGSNRAENLPATLEEEGEDEADRGRSSTSTRSASAPRDSTTDTQNNLLSPSSAAQAVRGPSSSGATPTFIPSSHALVAIPESEELSLPPSEAGDETEEGDGDSKKQDGEDKEEEGALRAFVCSASASRTDESRIARRIRPAFRDGRRRRRRGARHRLVSPARAAREPQPRNRQRRHSSSAIRRRPVAFTPTAIFDSALVVFPPGLVPARLGSLGVLQRLARFTPRFGSYQIPSLASHRPTYLSLRRGHPFLRLHHPLLIRLQPLTHRRSPKLTRHPPALLASRSARTSDLLSAGRRRERSRSCDVRACDAFPRAEGGRRSGTGSEGG